MTRINTNSKQRRFVITSQDVFLVNSDVLYFTEVIISNVLCRTGKLVPLQSKRPKAKRQVSVCACVHHEDYKIYIKYVQKLQ